MKYHQDIIIGILILIFCAMFCYFSLEIDAASALMPRTLLAIMALLGIMILLDGIRKTRASTEASPLKPFVTWATLKTPLTMFAFIVAYVVLFYAIGYYAATLVFLPIAMHFLKQRKWSVVAAITVVFLLFAYFFLVRQLNVSIDEFGVLGFWLQHHGA